MFTLEQIKHAHSKVRSGADFPGYIRDLNQLGVVAYDTYVTDGHTDYEGRDNFRIRMEARYFSLHVADACNESQFRSELLDHQQGKSDFPTFCRRCAQLGIEKWRVSVDEMTCTYSDKQGKVVLVERIPGVTNSSKLLAT